MHKKYEIYTNRNTGTYAYTEFRPYTTTMVNLERDIMLGATTKRIFVTGIPDGLSEHTNVALVERGAPRRLAVSSEAPLTESELRLIDKAFGRKPYPIPMLDDRSEMYTISGDHRPSVNFLAPIGPGPTSTLSRFVEYRFFEQRHQPATVLLDPYTGQLHRFVPPSMPIVIVMPENFIKTDKSSGYFTVDENLIVRIYSRYPLSARVELPDHNLYSQISLSNERTVNVCKQALTSLGLHKITYTHNDQIYGSDAFVTAVIGKVANINLPSYV